MKVECVTPAHAAGVASIEVTVNNADYTADGVKFEFVSDAAVTAVVPTSGPLSGDTPITISSAAGFSAALGYNCMFDAIVVPAAFISSSELRCVTPAKAASGKSTVPISSNLQQWAPTGSAYTYVSDLVMHSLEPGSGSAALVELLLGCANVRDSMSCFCARKTT
jgi:hypothetical protein